MRGRGEDAGESFSIVFVCVPTQPRNPYPVDALIFSSSAEHASDMRERSLRPSVHAAHNPSASRSRGVCLSRPLRGWSGKSITLGMCSPAPSLGIPLAGFQRHPPGQRVAVRMNSYNVAVRCVLPACGNEAHLVFLRAEHTCIVPSRPVWLLTLMDCTVISRYIISITVAVSSYLAQPALAGSNPQVSLSLFMLLVFPLQHRSQQPRCSSLLTLSS